MGVDSDCAVQAPTSLYGAAPRYVPLIHRMAWHLCILLEGSHILKQAFFLPIA